MKIRIFKRKYNKYFDKFRFVHFSEDKTIYIDLLYLVIRIKY
jgi:hypothetical protein